MKKIIFTLSILIITVAVYAQAPAKFNYQGIARNNTGQPISGQSVSLRISILNTSATGDVLYSETQDVTTNAYGLYNIEIGSGTIISGTMSGINWASSSKFIKIEMDPAGGSSYIDLGITQLLSVPYAMYATKSGSVSGGTANRIAKFTSGTAIGNSQIIDNGKGVGIGTTAITSRLSVIQPSSPVPAVDTFAALTASSYTAQACLKGAVFGNYNGSNYGVAIQGVGYNGVNNTDVNTNFAMGNQDLGVYGSANTAGVEGTSLNGIGVVGYNKNASFAATTGIGNVYGVYGNAQTVGGATDPTTRYGVYGFASGATTNYAGYFSGNMQVTGSISKGSGTFKIDHPLDPENKYLYHSFVESPDMMNIYNGNITTDASGYATVRLPDYFDALNKDFRYQLTVIGTFAQAIISQEVSDNQFVIQTNQPGVKVSWQVTGIRHDKYADAHRVVAEVEKEPEFRGYYLHAAEWGQPENKSIDYLTRPKDPATLNTRKPDIHSIGQTATPAKDKKEAGGAVLE